MTSIGGIIVLIELFLAEIVFLYSCPKRSFFAFRAIVSIGLVFVIGYFMPIPELWKFNQVFAFFRHLFLFGFTVLAVFICFDLKWDILIALCVASYGVQHIGYRVALILSKWINMNEIIITGDIWKFFEPAICILIDVVAYFVFGRLAAKEGYYKNHDKRLNVVSILTIFICIGMTRLTRTEELDDSLIVNLYAIMSCSLALVVQFAIHKSIFIATERKTIQMLWEEERKQFQVAKQTIDAINMKCHDMKHKLYDLDALPDKDETKELIRIYDNSLKTGNKVLNIVMMDYGLRYGKDQVEITFMGDGSCLSFMSDSDQYSIFGNAISNAVEAVLKIEEEKRTISITVEQRGAFVALSVSNHFNGMIKYDCGELVTSKENEKSDHGYGIKSMKLIAEKYGGGLMATAKRDIFYLDIYFVHNEMG